MSKGKSQNLTQATLLAESTVDNIISQGANRLYDNYIKTKIPKNVRSSLEKVIETGFNLFVSNTCNNRNQIKHIHQKEIQKINIVEEKRKIGSQVNAQKQKYSLSARNTIQVDSRVVKNGASKQVRSNKCHQRKRQSKVTSDCVPNFSEDSSSFQQKEQIDKIWVQRQQRLKQQLLREQQQKKTEQKNSSIKKRLQQQIRELQEKNKTITFNHHTGRIFRLDEHHQFNNQTNKWHKNIIRLKFGLTDKQDLCRKISQSKQLMVRNSRKITSFQRKRRKINFIDENVDDSSYNNNGKRQTSNFVFLEMQEGVHIAQGGNAKLSNNDSKIRKTRINSASLSHHQTFKSYTKEKIETSRCFKTIATAPSTAKTRYAKDDDKYLNKAVNTAKQSILSSQGVQFKNHKISKNAELMENYFSLNQEY